MNFEFFEELKDDYLQSVHGRGIFLGGVVLGYIAKCQAGKEQDIKSSPLFKQVQFGRMDMKSIKRLLARVPQLLAAYSEVIVAPQLASALAAEAGKMMLSSSESTLGTDGNFAFTVGFINANEYFWKIFKKDKEE